MERFPEKHPALHTQQLNPIHGRRTTRNYRVPSSAEQTSCVGKYLAEEALSGADLVLKGGGLGGGGPLPLAVGNWCGGRGLGPADGGAAARVAAVRHRRNPRWRRSLSGAFGSRTQGGAWNGPSGSCG